MHSDRVPSSRPTTGLLPRLDRTPLLALALIVLVTLATRLLVFPINEHVYGDAVSRTELAEDWARSPHLITSFGDGAAQYGPLHLYLIGGALTWVDRNDAARVVSFFFGVLTVVPLFALTRHYFGPRSALMAGLAFAVWGIHVQASTTGGSEAVSLFLFWTTLAWFARALYRPHWIPFAAAALTMNLAAATRYDAWMFIPLLAAMPLLQWRDRRRAALYGALFAALCLPFPVGWLIGNAAAHGDALYPFTYIDAYHREWAAQTMGTWGGELWFRLQGLGFWPAMALFTLTPGVAVLGTIGMAAAWRARPLTRWLTVTAAATTLYYTVRIAVLADFVPLGRFTVAQVSLLLPFIGSGLIWIVARYGASSARRIALLAAILAIAMPLVVGGYTLYFDNVVARVIQPVGPVATNPRAVMAAASFLTAEVVTPRKTLAIDADRTYQDLALVFFARVDPEHTVRVRWPHFRERIEVAPPDVVVLFTHGQLAHEPWVTLRGRLLTMAGDTYVERAGFSYPVRVFERMP